MTVDEFTSAYKHRKKVVVYLLRIGCPTSEADDIASQAWTRAWEKRDLLREPRYAITWVCKIALNLWRRAYRFCLAGEEVVDTLCQTDQNLDRQIYCQQILSHLSEENQKLLTDYYIQGETTGTRLKRMRARQQARMVAGRQRHLRWAMKGQA